MHFLPAHAAGNTVYVDSDSPGVQDGLTWNTAWHTIQQAVNDANFSGSGNTIIVAAGTYNEQVTLTSANAGADGAPNTIMAKPGDTPIVDANGIVNGVGFILGWNLGGANYITIDGFEIINGSWYGNVFAYKSSNVIVQNNIVHHNTYGGSGIYLTRCDNAQAINNTVYDIPNIAPGNAGYGIYHQNSMNVVARNNIVFDVGGSGIEFECANTTVPNDYGLAENNIVYNTRIAFNNNNVNHTTIRNNIFYNSTYGIVLNNYFNFPARLVQYNTISNNTIYKITGVDVAVGAITLIAQFGGDQSVYGNTISNNLIYESDYALRVDGMNDGSARATNNTFVNNTADNNTYGYYAAGYAENNIIKNNIFTNGDNGITVGANSLPLSANYNNVYNNTASYSGLTAGANDYNADPLFIDSVNHNFRLKSTAGSYQNGLWIADTTSSSLIDSGDPTSDYSNEPSFNGGRINLGYEGNTIYASKTYVAPATPADVVAETARVVLPNTGPLKYLNYYLLALLFLIMYYFISKLKQINYYR